jgi:hypothetical protein
MLLLNVLCAVSMRCVACVCIRSANAAIFSVAPSSVRVESLCERTIDMAKMTDAEARAYHARRNAQRALAKRAFLTLPLNQIAQANQYTTSIRVQPASVPTGRRG